MTIKHIRGSEDWYVITTDRAEEGEPKWKARRIGLYGPNVEASAEWTVFGRYRFGLGVRFGRNGGESDMGLDIHLGPISNVYLRLRSPWTKWLRVRESQPDKYDARHYGLAFLPHDGCLVRWDFGTVEHKMRRETPWWRSWKLTTRDIIGGTDCEVIPGETGVAMIPLPEGNYLATWKEEKRVWRHRRFPGTVIDRVKGTKVRNDVWLEIEGGIPHEGKGENSWDCGMDGLFGCGGRTLEDAIANAVRSTLRDRERYGPRKPLPRPMTVGEAEEWTKTA